MKKTPAVAGMSAKKLQRELAKSLASAAAAAEALSAKTGKGGDRARAAIEGAARDAMATIGSLYRDKPKEAIEQVKSVALRGALRPPAEEKLPAATLAPARQAAERAVQEPPGKAAPAPRKAASAPRKAASAPRKAASAPRKAASAPRKAASAPRKAASAPRKAD